MSSSNATIRLQLIRQQSTNTVAIRMMWRIFAWSAGRLTRRNNSYEAANATYAEFRTQCPPGVIGGEKADPHQLSNPAGSARSPKVSSANSALADSRGIVLERRRCSSNWSIARRTVETRSRWHCAGLCRSCRTSMYEPSRSLHLYMAYLGNCQVAKEANLNECQYEGL